MFRKYLRQSLSIVLAASGILKLTTISYVSDILFSLLPLAWVNTAIASHLGLMVIFVSIFELILGVMLLTSCKKTVLCITGSYLSLMLLFNGYQWQQGIGDCGCMGGWLQVSPELTMIKTLLLLGCTLYLLLPHAFSRQNRRLIHQS